MIPRGVSAPGGPSSRVFLAGLLFAFMLSCGGNLIAADAGVEMKLSPQSDLNKPTATAILMINGVEHRLW